MGIRWRLSMMMFLQYAIWGAWAPLLTKYLQDSIGLSGIRSGVILGLLPLASIVSPFIFGQLADRRLPAQRIFTGLHLLAGVALLVMATQTSFRGLFWLMAAYAFFYAPTLALSNSICFSHMKDPEKEFGSIRVWGTIGWIMAGWILASVRGGYEYVPKALVDVMRVVVIALKPIANGVHAVINLIGAKADLLVLAGLAALALAIFSLILPKTPPKKEGANPLAFLEALRLLKNRNFAIFMIISFVVATELEFYYMWTAQFLESLGVPGPLTSWVMTIAQIAEILVLVILLPRLLPKLGARKMLAIGVIAWPLRYAIFALLPIRWLVISSLTLHGFCYVFFFVVGFIYVDSVAPKDIRASAQSLVALVVLGLGRYFGNIIAGLIKDMFTTGDVVQWRMVFLIPCFLTVACAVAFLLAFREENRRTAPAQPG